MSSKSLTISTLTLPSSFAGASLSDFTTPWGLSRWPEAEAEPENGTGFGLERRGAVRFGVTQPMYPPEASLMLREAQRICCLILQQLPPQGLKEIAQALVDAYEFYAVPPSPTLALPARAQIAGGQKVRQFERPAFSIDDE